MKNKTRKDGTKQDKIMKKQDNKGQDRAIQ